MSAIPYKAYAVEQYKEAAVQTSPGKLVIALYDGAIRFSLVALDAMRRGDVAVQGVNLGKAQNILVHLNATLDMSAGAVSRELSGIYTYCLQRLLVANADDRQDYIEEVVALLKPLREAWETAEKTFATERASALDGLGLAR
jgi:flagellar secretion chaperone FliS